MARHYPSFTKIGVRILGISADSTEESANLVGDLSLPFDLLQDIDLRVASAYGVAMEGQDIAVPSIFIINQKGQIHYSHVGENMADRPNVLALLEKVRVMSHGVN